MHMKLLANVLLSSSGHFAQKTAILMMVPATVLFTMTVFVSSFLLHDHRHRKVFVGSVGLVASISMYSSPLVAMVGSFSHTIASLAY